MSDQDSDKGIWAAFYLWLREMMARRKQYAEEVTQNEKKERDKRQQEEQKKEKERQSEKAAEVEIGAMGRRDERASQALTIEDIQQQFLQPGQKLTPAMEAALQRVYAQRLKMEEGLRGWFDDRLPDLSTPEKMEAHEKETKEFAERMKELDREMVRSERSLRRELDRGQSWGMGL